MNLNPSTPLVQLLKYALVGCLNTILTLSVIFVCNSFLGINDYVSNAIGYVLGLINSFLWNKNWVFNSKGAYRKEVILFFLGFGICYGLQLLVVWLINKSWIGEEEFDFRFFVLSGYGIATLIGNVVYTGCNFLYNRAITFSAKAERGA